MRAITRALAAYLEQGSSFAYCLPMLEGEKLHRLSPFGAPIWRFLETTSTMDEGRRLLGAGASPGTVVVADSQSQGRGRLTGRQWTAPAGQALLATLILRPELAKLPGLTLRIGLALARACENLVDQAGGHLEVALKWPNDLLVSGRKVGGILCESTAAGLLVGFGINVAQSDFSGELSTSATSLALEAGRARPLDPPHSSFDRFKLLDLALREIHQSLEEVNWRKEVISRLWKLGEEISIGLGSPGRGEVFNARVEGIAENGALMVVDCLGEARLVFSGEVGTTRPR